MSSAIKECFAEHKELLQVHDHCPERPYVELQVPQDSKRVVAVSFTAVAHDQGWADRTEEPSFTWFDASVKRPEGRGDLRTITVFHNRLAKPDFFELQARWHTRDGPRRRLWIAALKPGDVIQLIPRAIYIAWVNIIKEARIKIEYEPKELHEELNELHLSTNVIHYSKPLRMDEQDIRLLHVEPGAFDAPIKGYFSRASLEDIETGSLKFHALSYCWGDPFDREDISLVASEDLVDDAEAREPFSVGRTVAQVLRRLRSTNEPLIIWIDAVCINQADLEERAHQVTLMSRIYSLASTVRIWLGEDNVGVETCLRLIRDIFNYNNRQCPGGDECSCSGTKHPLKLADIDAYMDTQKKEGRQISFHGMWEIFDLHEKTWSREIIDLAGWYGNTQLSFLMSVLFENPWFTRVWVIQEALSARNALVHCSAEQIPWEELIEINTWLGHRIFWGQSPHIISQRIMAPIWSALKPKGKTTELPTTPIEPEDKGQLSTIFEIFIAGLDLKATDPRDKLFALLTFADETHVSGDLDELIRPNYDKSVDRVFADFTRWWIREYGSLSTLSAVHCHPGRTWRRTLGSDHQDTPISGTTWSVSSKGSSRWAQASLDARFKFRASGDSKPDIELLKSSNPMILQLSGLRVSQISAISAVPIEYLYPYRNDNGEQSEISAVLHKLLDPCGLTGFWSLKPNIEETENKVQTARTKYNDHMRAHWVYAQRPKLKALVPTGAPIEEWYETDKLPTCFDPCFFVASDGRFGLCPWGSKEGDMIVLLDGGNVPYLLRSIEMEGGHSDTVFEFVGECFVNGIMHGEFLGEDTAVREVFDLI
ncbi:hypothetical protein NM208_g611 [Fusarium decemcellulare]|uniref:Uncharacterized protein n=1 Tax=Fusarium decemcellulare TaxID=57161 RepID=A0ACC1SZ23_9HYPO|nr:hypothetical protein NM208_g611 [Fusarium decemcellulare]